MGIVEATGIVTREIKYGESSRILTVITKELGRISILAGGARSNKSGLLHLTQLFSYGTFTLFQSRGKGLYKINSGDLITSFSNLRNSLEGMAYASYFSEIANRMIPEDAPDPEQMQLLLNALYMLAEEKLPPEQIKAVYEFRTLSIQGLLPSFSACSHCGQTENLRFFHPIEEAVWCTTCTDENHPGVITFGESLIKAIAYIEDADPKKVFAFHLPEQSLSYLSSLGEYCLELQLEKHLKTLDYLKSVKALEN